MSRFTPFQRQELRQLTIESEVLHLSTKEALAYIKAKSGHEIGPDYLQNIRHSVKKSSLTRLAHYQHSRYAYLYEYFQRIDEIKKYQQELWSTILTNPNNGFLKKHCITELHQLTITLTNLYEMLPEYTANIATRTSTTPINEQEEVREEQGITSRVY